MSSWRWSLLIMLALVLSFSMIIACGDDDDDDDDDNDDNDDNDVDDDDDDDDNAGSCTVTDICTLVYDKCPEHDQWESVEECVANWFELCPNDTMDTDGYMDCVCACFNANDSCDDFFNNCEWACWDTYCP